MYLHVRFNIACQAKVPYQDATAICCWHFWKKGEGTVYPTLHGRSGLDVLKFLRITDALFQHQVFRSWWLQRILDNLKLIIPWTSNEIPMPMKDNERACLNMLDVFLKTYIPSWLNITMNATTATAASGKSCKMPLSRAHAYMVILE
jgi:signal transduction histidine kinase